MAVKTLSKAKKAASGPISYKTKTIKVKNEEELLAQAKRGDIVHVRPDAKAIKLDPTKEYRVTGITPETEDVEGSLELDGTKVLAEWIILSIIRKERIRAKVDMKKVLLTIKVFAGAAFQNVKAGFVEQVRFLENEEVEVRNKLDGIREKIADLKDSKTASADFVDLISSRLTTLLESGLYTNFERHKEGDHEVLYAYTPTLGEASIGDYLVKIYPKGCSQRIVIENLAPGNSNVPCAGDGPGLSNVCFGKAADKVRSAVDAEEWPILLTLLHDFLDGDGKIKN